MPQQEVVTLSEIHCEGLYLRVRDGRTLMINPNDVSIVLDWAVDQKLVIAESGLATTFRLHITSGNGSRVVHATWV